MQAEERTQQRRGAVHGGMRVVQPEGQAGAHEGARAFSCWPPLLMHRSLS